MEEEIPLESSPSDSTIGLTPEGSVSSPTSSAKSTRDLNAIVDSDIDACLELLHVAIAKREETLDASPSADTRDDSLLLAPSCVAVPPSEGAMPVGSLPDSSAQRFVPTRILGAGSFGVVVAARDTFLERNVALKILRPSLGQSVLLRSRFLREARTSAALEHPGIVPLYETGRIAQQPYIATAIIEGPNLAQFLRERSEPISVRQAAWLLSKIAEAVHFAHQRGVLHRDIKPSNVLLEATSPESSEGLGYTPKLTDFGLAKRMDQSGENHENLSHGCRVLGTLRYMSPEQATGQFKDVAVPSDVFSLGSVFYQLLSGSTPFEGANEAETLANIVRCHYKPLPTRGRSRIVDVQRILDKCLAKQPEERYRSAGDLATDLQSFLLNRPIVGVATTPLRRLHLWVNRHPQATMIASLAAISLVVCIGSISYAYVQTASSLADQKAALDRERLALAKAEKNLDFALEAVNKAYVHVAENVLEDVPNSASRVLDLHQRSLAFHKEFAEQNHFDAKSRYLLSIAYHYAGTSYARLGEWKEANAHRLKCLDLVEQLVEEDPQNLDYRYDLFFNLMLHSVESQGLNGHELSESISEKAVNEIHKILEIAPDDPVYLDAAAAIHFQLAGFRVTSQPESARELLNEATEISRQLIKKYPKKPLYAKHAICSLARLATIACNEKNYSEAENLCRQSLDLLGNSMGSIRDEIWVRWIEHEVQLPLIDALTHLERWNELEYELDNFIDNQTVLAQFHDHQISLKVLRLKGMIQRAEVLYELEREGEAVEACDVARRVLDTTPAFPEQSEFRHRIEVIAAQCKIAIDRKSLSAK